MDSNPVLHALHWVPVSRASPKQNFSTDAEWSEVVNSGSSVSSHGFKAPFVHLVRLLGSRGYAYTAQIERRLSVSSWSHVPRNKNAECFQLGQYIIDSMAEWLRR